MICAEDVGGFLKKLEERVRGARLACPPVALPLELALSAGGGEGGGNPANTDADARPPTPPPTCLPRSRAPTQTHTHSNTHAEPRARAGRRQPHARPGHHLHDPRRWGGGGGCEGRGGLWVLHTRARARPLPRPTCRPHIHLPACRARQMCCSRWRPATSLARGPRWRGCCSPIPPAQSWGEGVGGWWVWVVRCGGGVPRFTQVLLPRP